MPEDALTQEEQQYAEEHHALVLWFLKYKQLPYDEWYDIIVFGYLKAVKRWLRRPEIQRQWTFAVIAKVKMNDEYIHHLHYLTRMMRCGSPLIYLDSFVDDCEESLQNVISLLTSEDVQENVLSNIMVDNFASTLSPKQRQMLKLRAQGYSHRESGAVFGVSESHACRLFSQIKRGLRQQLVE